MLDLSIIILSYNTKAVTKRCLVSLINNLKKSPTLTSEIIVVDNASTDGSFKMLESFRVYKNFKLIKNKNNVGFAKANNQALKITQGKYILFLNSDVIVDKLDFSILINYLEKDPKVGVLTVKINLPTKKIDPACHRGFPTIWNSLCYFLKLEKIFGRLPFLGKIFGGYHLTYLNLDAIHEVDTISGAFFLTRKNILEKVRGFDEEFFIYGEDIDLCFRIKHLGYKIIYYPLFQVIHLKYTSGIKKNNSLIKKQFYEAMKIFYRKHYQKKYPWFINKLIYFFVDFKSRF